jgi:hypothetical protein
MKTHLLVSNFNSNSYVVLLTLEPETCPVIGLNINDEFEMKKSQP